MTNKSKDKLAELIHSMTRSEKRYFKLFAQRHTIGESNKYVYLFDEIEGTLPYNEEYIFEKFKGDSMINNFNVTKKRLYDQIIRALNQYYSETTITSQLNEFLNTIETLFIKGLYDQASNKINVAKKIADQHDQLSYYLIFLKWESKLKSTRPKLSAKTSINQIFEEEIRIVKNIQDEQKLQNLKDRLVNLQRQYAFDDKKEDINNIRKEVLAIRNNNLLSLQLELDIKSTLALVYFIKKENKNAIQLLTEKQEILNKNKNRIRRAPFEFMSDLAHLIQLEIDNKLYKLAFEHIKTLKSFPKNFKIKKTQNFEIRFFATVQSLELTYFIKQLDFKNILSIEDNIITSLNKFTVDFPQTRKAYFYYILAIAHFYSGNSKEAQVYSDKIKSEIKNPSTSIIAVYNKWLSIFINIDLKEYELAQDTLPSTKKFLLKNTAFNQADSEVVNTLLKIDGQLSDEEINTILKKHLKSLDKINEKQLMNLTKSYFDYNSWIKSKIQGISIEEQINRNKY